MARLTRTDAAPVGARPGFVVTLALAMASGPFMLHALTAMSPLVVEDLGLSRTQFGSFATVSFVVAALASGLAGRLVDRVDGRVMLVALHLTGAAALVVAAAAQSYAWLLVGVSFSGVALAMSNPLTNRLVVAFTGVEVRGTVMGIKQSGVQAGQAVAGLVLPGLALVIGWRGSLGAACALALLGLALTARHVPPAAPERPARGNEGASRPRPLPRLVWWLATYAFLTGFALQAGNVYLPLYGYQALGLASAAAGALTAVVGAVGLVARIFWGRVVGRVEAPRTVLVVLAGGGALAMAAILLAETVHPWLVWAGAAVFGATGLAANVVLMVTVLRVVPRAVVGRATGALSIGLFVGFAAGPVAVGALLDTTGDYAVGWGVTLAVFLAAAVLVLVRRDWSKSVS